MPRPRAEVRVPGLSLAPLRRKAKGRSRVLAAAPGRPRAERGHRRAPRAANEVLNSICLPLGEPFRSFSSVPFRPRSSLLVLFCRGSRLRLLGAVLLVPRVLFSAVLLVALGSLRRLRRAAVSTVSWLVRRGLGCLAFSGLPLGLASGGFRSLPGCARRLCVSWLCWLAALFAPALPQSWVVVRARRLRRLRLPAGLRRRSRGGCLRACPPGA